jgi:hypothetical protein
VAALAGLRVDPEHELGEVFDDGLVETGVADASFVLLAAVGLDQAWEAAFEVEYYWWEGVYLERALFPLSGYCVKPRSRYTRASRTSGVDRG